MADHWWHGAFALATFKIQTGGFLRSVDERKWRELSGFSVMPGLLLISDLIVGLPGLLSSRVPGGVRSARRVNVMKMANLRASDSGVRDGDHIATVVILSPSPVCCSPL
jgi:hypothetical protein